jgi:hypothetical protein
MLNIFKGITFPAKAVEGAISIVETVSVTGDGTKPSVAAPVKQGDAVAIVGDNGELPLIAKATGANGVIVGFAHDHPEYDEDPTQAYTEAQAKTADVLRKCGVESVFSDIRTVPAKASEAIKAGMYVEWSADGWKKTASSGTTISDAICLIGQTSEDEISIGIK